MKILKFHEKNNENHENPRMSSENYEIMKIQEFHVRIIKIKQIMELHMGITKIMKFLELIKRKKKIKKIIEFQI